MNHLQSGKTAQDKSSLDEGKKQIMDAYSFRAKLSHPWCFSWHPGLFGKG